MICLASLCSFSKIKHLEYYIKLISYTNWYIYSQNSKISIFCVHIHVDVHAHKCGKYHLKCQPLRTENIYREQASLLAYHLTRTKNFFTLFNDRRFFNATFCESFNSLIHCACLCDCSLGVGVEYEGIWRCLEFSFACRLLVNLVSAFAVTAS